MTSRARHYWLDWLRTQSVWNVVCGHTWWYAKDLTGLSAGPSHDAAAHHGIAWGEVHRMMEYVADMGLLHTIPVFFVISGVLTSYTLKVSRTGIKKFGFNRSVRILPPLIVGLALELFCRNLIPAPQRDNGSLFAAFTSTLWFLWAFALVPTQRFEPVSWPPRQHHHPSCGSGPPRWQGQEA